MSHPCRLALSAIRAMLGGRDGGPARPVPRRSGVSFGVALVRFNALAGVDGECP